MPLYDYTGQLQSGAAFRGTLEASTPDHARATLHDMGVRVMALRAARTAAYVSSLSLDDFLFFNEQVAAITKAGLPLDEGLRNLAADVGSRKLKRVLNELADEVASGTPLPDAVERMKSRFPTNYAGIVRAGLQTGDLGASLYGLTAHLRLKGQFQRALAEVAVYPLVILLFTLGMMSFLMRNVAPAIEQTVLDMGIKYFPIISGAIFEMSHVWPAIEIGIWTALGVLLIVWIVLCTPPFRAVRERVLRMIPGIARVYWSSVLARFAHTSALAAFSGVPLPELIATAAQASGSAALGRAAGSVRRRLEAGESLDQAARAERDIPALWTSVVLTAGPRGELPAALQELARAYETRARQWSGVVRLILAPLLLLGVGITLGLLILGMLLPMVQMIQGLTQ